MREGVKTAQTQSKICHNKGEFVMEANKTKPTCKLIGQDGNIFNLIGITSRTLKRAGMQAEAKEMYDRVFGCSSYSEALTIIGEYVDIV